MKKILGGIVVSALLAAPALAADLPARMPVKAPPAPIVAVFNWTGCYIGGHVGYALGQSEVTPDDRPVDSRCPNVRPETRWRDRRRRSGRLQSLAARPLGVRHRRPGAPGLTWTASLSSRDPAITDFRTEAASSAASRCVGLRVRRDRTDAGCSRARAARRSSATQALCDVTWTSLTRPRCQCPTRTCVGAGWSAAALSMALQHATGRSRREYNYMQLRHRQRDLC